MTTLDSLIRACLLNGVTMDAASFHEEPVAFGIDKLRVKMLINPLFTCSETVQAALSQLKDGSGRKMVASCEFIR